ncbi:MAG: YdeI family protein [Pseudomonadota bacterium]
MDDYISRQSEYKAVLTRLRKLLLSSGLDETFKWGTPTYVLEGKNVVGLAAFKSYVGLWFHQGVFLEDSAGVLINAQANRTRAMRQWRFDPVGKIDLALVRAYIAEAIANQQAGKALVPRRKPEMAMPRELAEALEEGVLDARFRALSEGRRREYINYIAEAKRAETRLRRVNRILPLIAAGVGLNDRYRQ